MMIIILNFSLYLGEIINVIADLLCVFFILMIAVNYGDLFIIFLIVDMLNLFANFSI